MASTLLEQIFGKSRDQIDINDIKTFFSTPQEETSVLEFKSGGIEIIDLYKEITAFLNTEGGLIIIGSPKESTLKIGKNEIKICQGDLTYSAFRNKDWLFQKIASNIVPTPVNLTISEFLSPEGNIFIIDVPQSLSPPHQCGADGKYYIRLEREAKPAPYGLIKALFNKRRTPILTSEIEVRTISNYLDNISVKIKNTSSIPAEKVNILLDVYNIDNIESKLNFRHSIYESLDKFSFFSSPKQILVQIINFEFEFKAQHNMEDYVIFIAYWCRNLDINYDFCVYSPSQGKTIFDGNQEDYSDVFEHIDEIINKRKSS